METYNIVPGGKVKISRDPEKVRDLSNYTYMRGDCNKDWRGSKREKEREKESLVQHLTDCTGQTEP